MSLSDRKVNILYQWYSCDGFMLLSDPSDTIYNQFIQRFCLFDCGSLTVYFELKFQSGNEEMDSYQVSLGPVQQKDTEFLYFSLVRTVKSKVCVCVCRRWTWRG